MVAIEPGDHSLPYEISRLAGEAVVGMPTGMAVASQT